MNPIKNKKNLETTIEEIRNFAYAYLEKYSPSKQQLKIYLFKKLVKKNQKITSKKEIFDLIDVVISTLIDQNLLNDKYYSDAKSKAFLRRGYSINKIRYSLIKKGIQKEYIDASISKIKAQEADPDFFSAIKICKRRRIGPIRDENNRVLFFKKDMSILARSGFAYELSKKVLEITKEEFKKFLKMI
tara:strand:- start:8 stop:568 length:561 start_codon:yes stop_codon:yes gene_type:complete